ncbi:MAG: DUF4926 domain-containing protein [Pegethrix bostrychoides GSE-TBD4-15B]|jgi:hypothetical protein|uniref:DUF4926 domain-containing protein n=1 Tax=Pegethrix bostrychoides GSE-TBD4-15B TaxID=2839662 RepID=A0A951U3L4_9CYAN|nr:DUF4926 domain-containing protein [Pegethrix bostrychoides GSE-TBD4-15B]
MVSTISQLCLLDVVALKAALPEQNLFPGQVGTIIELLAPEVYEVEFSDDQGQTYAMLPLHASQLLKLHYSPTQEDSPMSNTIHQYGQGDNISGDKVMRDKIGTQINNSQNLAQAAQEIKALLTQLDQDYDSGTPTGQAMISAKTIEKIESNPTLKARVVNALKEGGAVALESAIDHPAVKPVVALLKGFMDA